MSAEDQAGQEISVEQANKVLKEAATVENEEQKKQRKMMETMMARRMMMQKVQSVQPSGMSMYFTQFDMVCQFHILMDTWRAITNIVPTEAIDRRIKIVDEEVNKELMPLLHALRDGTKTTSIENLVELLDHIVDSVYVLLGTAAEFGLPFDMGFEIVHQANMAKFANGVVKNEYGKLVKPEGWKPPTEAMNKMLQDFWTRASLSNSQEHQVLKGKMEAEAAASSVANARDGKSSVIN